MQIPPALLTDLRSLIEKHVPVHSLVASRLQAASPPDEHPAPSQGCTPEAAKSLIQSLVSELQPQIELCKQEVARQIEGLAATGRIDWTRSDPNTQSKVCCMYGVRAWPSYTGTGLGLGHLILSVYSSLVAAVA